ncbi:MAG TPA: protein-disulfide reductase DsbD domain-containing protein, partial [Verrucomicrobiae bacterium]|nr:protein-disulfide reductase DsbD domain-containing protein [Verrucomicrobiae bacterium]
MRLTIRMLVAVLLCLLCFSAEAAHTEARLMLERDSARPGETVMAGVLLRMDEGWHTYWQNSGDSGMPTSIDWQLPAGVTAGAIQWPIPEKLPEKELTTYIYTHEVVLLVPLTLSAKLPPGPLDLKAKVSWLECQLQCNPGKAEVRAQLEIGPESKASKDAPFLAQWQKKLPAPGDAISAQARWDGPAQGDTRSLLLSWSAAKAVSSPDFFPDSSDGFEVSGNTERIPADGGNVSLRKQIKKLGATWPNQISGLLVQGSDNQQTAFQVKLPIIEGPGASALAALPGTTAGPVEGPSFWQMLLYAFIGGLILNVMPCVLPVIALKILGCVGQAKEAPGRARRLSLVYALGVLVSFAVLAGLVLGVKAAGHKAGWGIQFGNPYF